MTLADLNIIQTTSTLGDALRGLNESPKQVLVVIEEGRLIGTVTDGDVRRSLLRGCSLETPVREIMKEGPISAPAGTPAYDLIKLMRGRSVRYVPLTDKMGGVVDIVDIDELVEETQPSRAFIMAGGLGKRLRPLTKTCPKPMLKVGGRPLLETLVLQLRAHGFIHITIAINYLGEQIKKHFGDGTRFGVDIIYVEEKEQRGTAGALALLPEVPREPLLVLNGDLLTAIDFRAMINFHTANGAVATMGVRNFIHQVPYGVINTRGVEVTSIDEKPSREVFVNAGIYVVEPSFVVEVPDEYIDMTDMFSRILHSRDHRVAAYPIHEYWRDIGRSDDFERANAEYSRIFGTLIGEAQ